MTLTSRTWQMILASPSCSIQSQLIHNLLNQGNTRRGSMASLAEHIRGRLPNGIRVVAIGGGTGLSTLLKGLKQYTVHAGEIPPEGQFISDLTAVVTVSDDGGSSGRLRRELGML